MATSRLKKKLGDDVAPSLLESFVSLGTPLPSLADKVDAGEFKPIWEQEVVDEKGRRRLHGAFTGGFSAGYGNTVGSKEGWTPSTFTSSRAIRASNAGSKSTAELAQGLMDEEDLAELASSRTLQTSTAYSAPSSAAPPPVYDPLLGIFDPLSSSSTSTIPSATAQLASLIEPSSSRIGLKLMRRMGWRDGQGVGPRVTLQQRRKMGREIGVPVEHDEGEEAEEEAKKHYYAPLDRPLPILEEGNIGGNGWGLGYEKEGPLVVGAQRREEGAGLRLEEEEDEDNVYGGSSLALRGLPGAAKKHLSVVDLDAEQYGTLDRVSGTASSRGKKGKQERRPPTTTKENFHDGTRILPGFTIHHDASVGPSLTLLPPPPPKGWKPNPTLAWKDSPTAAEKGKGKQLDADERGNLLGEKQAPPVPKSVFEYLNQKDKERLARLTHPSISSALPSTSASTSSLPPVAEPDEPLHIPSLDSSTALSALKGFQPFSTSSTSPDAIRQSRYTLFLQFKAGILPPSSTSTLPFGPRPLPTGKLQTIKEFNRELDEYAKAAKVFKPVSGMLAGRFTSSGAGNAPLLDEPKKPEPGLYQPPPKVAAPPPSAPTTEEKEIDIGKLNPAQNAARLGMFGHLTRTSEIWRPGKLLCKRFGVKVPYEGDAEEMDSQPGGAWGEAGSTAPRGGHGGGGGGKTGEVLGKKSMETLMMSTGFRRLQPDPEPQALAQSEEEPKTAVVRASDGPSLATVGLGDDEAQGEETLTYVKAPRDIFSAIFADSDDEEEDDDEEEVEPEDVVETKKSDGKLAPLPTSSTILPLPAVLPGIEPSPPAPDESASLLSSDTISSYRPSFVPASSRPKATENSKGGKPKKRKKEKVATLSFDIENGDGDVNDDVQKVKKKRKEKPEKKREKEEEEDDWVEVPSKVDFGKSETVGSALVVEGAPPPASGGGSKRARAADLFD